MGTTRPNDFARKTKEQWDDEGNPLPRESAGEDDSRRPPGDYFIPRDVVDSWAVEDEEELAKVHDEDEEKDSGCAEKWQNMKEVHTSGELAKYAFALLAHLCKALGPEIAKLILGYDIGCRFYKMVMRHPRVSDLLQDREFLALVGSFHGTAHNRLWLRDFLLGVQCPRRPNTLFNRLPPLAGVVTWAEHKDRFQTYGQLSHTLVTKYRHALAVIAEAPVLARLTSELNGATSATLEGWLKAEREYLSSLKKEPEEETLQMEYYQALVNFYDAKWPEVECDRFAAVETNRRHVCERENKCLEAVRYLEARLEVVERWQPGDENWIQAQVLVSKRRYQLALDKLESLVAARLLELWKMNIPGTAVVTHAGARAQGSGRAAVDLHFKIKRAKEEVERLNVEIRRLYTYSAMRTRSLRITPRRLDNHQPQLAYQVEVHPPTAHPLQ
ncbi:hypothetical protein MSAN_00715000 [Mycena sanguinolenta]|uniref:Uncharacterized protein n=1 Tax=Mycena sanguinolenta TaxID=230812 RepID=A0A8H6Z4J5_9AGAR|nr:hypothetical protein MSAN_00715000 [Mycena sanguinolenta]